ncbi:TatA/E family twin arginine-targeting protein translocase [Nodosilinea sp. LEGE 07088]|uniref:TatA/E family twin arginine-targeting protein translocase n=1 Tax=Nodosilinea sp. LEGE 07088 TaxID=2777968 RepID=UPI00187E9929|nr:TatA/E family twin arginine-targeting protein translocase [Nodosilinea sp. LEGE 07088]MBE9139508.1 TatA/E family twin arginine-targeting protein translocase [Nodosilinea sp. LEGE 07088]
MNVFGVGLPEMALILVLALLVFGPKKLPEIGRSMGKALKGFQDASREFEEEFKKEAQQIEKAVTTPMKATLEPDSPKVLTPPEAAAEAEIPNEAEMPNEAEAGSPAVVSSDRPELAADAAESDAPV